ncbi:hypothetical protein, partial [Hungatella effluvii]|uniref:hypothetical protein n=1 Tax=Hungatella effluvii TaxID=1096246 RepID=UPI002A806F88
MHGGWKNVYDLRETSIDISGRYYSEKYAKEHNYICTSPLMTATTPRTREISPMFTAPFFLFEPLSLLLNSRIAPNMMSTIPKPTLKTYSPDDKLSRPLSIAPSIFCSIYSTSILFTCFIKSIETINAIDRITIANKYITALFAVAFTTILHRREAIKTADTIVVGTDFFINPMPADIMPMLAAMKDMISVISIACARIKSVKLSF